MNRRYSSAEQDAIRDDYLGGMMSSAIKFKYGCDRSYASKLVKRAGLQRCKRKLGSPPRLTLVQAREARRLHLDSPEINTHVALARSLGVTPDTIKSSFERVKLHDDRSNEQTRSAEHDARQKECRPVTEAIRERAKRLLASEIADTRDLTARICGDPMPGRSALDMRGRQA